MGLLNKLKTGQGSPLSYTNGGPVNKPTAQGPYAPGFAVFNNEDSQLHFEYSINGNPFIANQKGTVQPSVLDLNGLTPQGYQAPETGINPNNLVDLTPPK